jgi:hypothetical protein
VGHLRRAPSVNWRAAYRTPEGKERTKTFKTKREARAFLAQVEGDKTSGLYVDPAGSQLRFRELAERWWAAREVELTTAAANRSRLDNHVLPMWGEWPIGRIEHLDVQAWGETPVSPAGPGDGGVLPWAVVGDPGHGCAQPQARRESL